MASERGDGTVPAGRPASRAREGAAAAGWIGLAAALVSLAYLSLYFGHRYAYPVGYDTPRYLYRANLAAAHGLGVFSADTSTDATRVGNPTLTTLVAAVLGISTLHLSFVWPAVIGTITGLAGGAFAVSGLDEPAWSFSLYAVAVGMSINLASVAGSLLDNLLVSPLLMAAAATAVLAAAEDASIFAAILLLAAASLMEWYFAALMVGIVAAAALAMLPESLRTRRAGTRMLRTPSGRLAMVAGGSALAGGAALLLAPGSPQRIPREGHLFASQLSALVPRFRFWLTGPLMALGAIALAVPKAATRRRGLVFALVWSGSGAVAVGVSLVVAHVPASRVLDAAFALPVLATASLIGLVRLLRLRMGTAGTVLGVAVLVVGVIAWALAGRSLWLASRPLMSDRAYAEAASAGRYLQEVAPQVSAVLAVSSSTASEGKTLVVASRTIRSAMPGEVLPRVYLVFADPDELIAAQVTGPGSTTFGRPLSGLFVDATSLPGEPPVIVALAAYDPGFVALASAHADRIIAPGVIVVQGPLPGAAPVAVAPPTSPSKARLVLWTAAVLLLLWVVGIGWAVSLVRAGGRARTLSQAALATAFGMAALVLVGLAGSLAGVALRGGQALVLVLVAAALGWAPAVMRALKKRSSPASI